MNLKLVIFIIFSFPMLSFAADKQSLKEVLLDNEAVEVVRLTFPVGTESGMHTHQHPNRVVYFVKGGKLEVVADGVEQKTTAFNVPDGKTLYMPAASHNVRNIGDTEIIMIETEIK